MNVQDIQTKENHDLADLRIREDVIIKQVSKDSTESLKRVKEHL